MADKSCFRYARGVGEQLGHGAIFLRDSNKPSAFFNWLNSFSGAFHATRSRRYAGVIFGVMLWFALPSAYAQWDSRSVIESERFFSDAAPSRKPSDLPDRALALVQEYYYKEVDTSKILGEAMAKFCLTQPICPCDPKQASEIRDFSELRTWLQHTPLDGRPTQETIIWRAVALAMQQLDHYSGYLDPEAMRELQIGASGKFGGLGMVVDAKSGKYVVVAVFQDSPAHNAGIRPGDTVVAVDGVSPAGLPMNDVLKKVRGPVGSVIHLTLHEKNTGAERSLKLRRRLIRVAPVRYGIVTPGIGYLRIVNFQQNTLKQTEAALTRMLQSPEGLKGLILDLRDNPGGLFGEAVQIADIFVTQGVITRVTGRHPKFRQTVSAKPRSKCPEIPIVILINSGTASAAEILAGALQGREKVAVMGEPSFGKASVQAVFPLGNAGVRITVAAYLTAAGRDIDGVGLEPDIKLKDDHPDPSLMYDPDAFHSDPWIREAVQVLTGHGDVQ